MSKTFGCGDSTINYYAEEIFRPQDESLKKIVSNTEKAAIPQIQVGAMDGLHLEVLTKAIGASRAVEIGTLGGYSGVCIARGLTSGGKLYTCEINQLNADVAKENFKLTRVDDMVEILVGPALKSLEELSKFGPFDLVFIDADKPNYPNYFDWASKNVRIGGTILADNTFAWGMIASTDVIESEKPSVEALRIYNKKAATHPNFRSTILPTGEGLTVSVRVK